MRWKYLTIGLLACLLVAGASLAATTTGQLSGTVVDSDGEPLPGVTVTIASPALIGGPRIAVTDMDGTFVFPALDPGMYTVKVELDGFATQERSEVQVRLARTTELNIVMPSARFGEEISVVAETPVVDPTQVSTSQTFTSDYLTKATVGAVNRGYQNVLAQAAGAAQTTDGGANPHVLGSTYAENAWYIDGLDTTDPVTATFGTNFNFDAIQEIAFQTGGYEAEYGRATGGVVNLITKSGGNDFSGTFDLRYRSTSFYENGDHFTREENRSKYVDPSATLGGPLLQDRIWFFLSGEDIDSQRTPSGAPTTRKYVGQNYIGKVTWQIDPSWRAVGKVSGDPAVIHNRNASRFVEPEASYRTDQGGSIYQGEVSGILSPSVLWNFSLAYNRGSLDSYPESGDLDTIGFISYEGISHGNYTNAQYSDRNRDEYKTSATYFLDNLAGSHELKGGLEYARTLTRGSNNTTGNGNSFEDRAGQPRRWFYSPLLPAAEATGTLQSAYAQDAWRPLSNLTLKIGARWDQASYRNDADVKIATLDKLQPRIGAAWDITGDAKNVAKASWGRFMHPNALTMPKFVRTQPSPSYTYFSCSYWVPRLNAAYGVDYTCGEWGDAYSGDSTVYNDPVGYDPAGWFLYFETGGTNTNVVDPNLRPMYADELVLGFERELFNRTSIEISYVDKKTKDIFEDTCNGNVQGDLGGACDYYIMTQLPELKRSYQGVMVRFESRARDWFHVLASYTYSKSKGSIEDTQNSGIDFDVYPDHFVNTYGYLSDDRRHRVKLNGYVMLPYDVVLGADAFWSSAFPYNATEPADSYGDTFVLPRGSLRANSTYQLDLQVSKGFRFGPVRTQLIGAIYNVLGTEQVNVVCEEYNGCSNTIALGDPAEWQTPRRYELGFRIEF